MRFLLLCLVGGALMFGCGDGTGTTADVNAAEKTCNSPDCCFSDDDCGENEYCEGDGACDTEGTCKVIGHHPCGLAFDPVTGVPTDLVCGCDGITYQGPCQATSSGHRIAHDGVCEADICWSDDDCGENEYCDGQGPCDSGGMCRAIMSRSCPPSLELPPVCGCDGVTYQDWCGATSSGVRIGHDGACD